MTTIPAFDYIPSKEIIHEYRGADGLLFSKHESGEEVANVALIKTQRPGQAKYPFQSDPVPVFGHTNLVIFYLEGIAWESTVADLLTR
jgi:hypothetical protein